MFQKINEEVSKKNDEVEYLEDDSNFEDGNFLIIKGIVDSADTKKYGFESQLLEFILCKFIQFSEDNGCDVMPLFRKLFTNFSIYEYITYEDKVDISLNLFEYVNVVNDLFLPHFTAENFVKTAVKEYIQQKDNKIASVTLRFAISV